MGGMELKLIRVIRVDARIRFAENGSNADRLEIPLAPHLAN